MEWCLESRVSVWFIIRAHSHLLLVLHYNKHLLKTLGKLSRTYLSIYSVTPMWKTMLEICFQIEYKENYCFLWEDMHYFFFLMDNEKRIWENVFFLPQIYRQSWITGFDPIVIPICFDFPSGLGLLGIHIFYYSVLIFFLNILL